MFMRPAPDKFLKKLLANGDITEEQARLAKLVPMSDDVAVESDSGGHTDNRPIHVILPLIMALRDRIQRELKYPTQSELELVVVSAVQLPWRLHFKWELPL